MRYPASEKAEIIQLVEQSHLPAKKTLDKLGIPRATFYRWHKRYREGGPEALADHRSRPDRVWNRIPGEVRQHDHRSGTGCSRAVTTRAGCALHRRETLLCLGILGLSPAEGPRSDHKPGLSGNQGGE